MREQRIGCVLVPDAKEKLSGIFTERGRDAQPDHLLAHAFHLMMVNDLRYLPVVDDAGCPAGIVNSCDLIEYLAKLVME